MRAAALAAPVAAAVALAAAPSAVAARSPVRVDERPGARLVVSTPSYRLVLSRRDGSLLELRDVRTGTQLVAGSAGCWWRADAVAWTASTDGCAVARRRGGFSYRWAPRARRLELRYDGTRSTPRPVRAIVTLLLRESAIDVRLRLENGRRGVIREVSLPTDLLVPVAAAQAGYSPTYLPGIRLGPGFFAGERNTMRIYPSRWAIADFLAVDVGRSHLAVAGLDAAPRPVRLGFVRGAPPDPCSGAVFCVRHAFQTWIVDGGVWTSPPVRIDVGRPVEQTLAGYREATGIARYPSVREKLGVASELLVRAPLVKADARAGLGRFRDWGSGVERLPVPVLLHPVSFQPGGHDEGSPDFLPPDPSLGTADEFVAALGRVREAGSAVMPYLNLSWWDDDGAALRGVDPKTVAVLDAAGRPVHVTYTEGRGGLVVSPFAEEVVRRYDAALAEWGRDVPADCVFLDQVGARPWLADFNPASPSPLAYADGWLALLARHPDRCVMVEDGWDRLARSAAGFHGSALMLAREHDETAALFGEGNWEPWPLGPFLFGDKVLAYHHDLFPATLTEDLEVLRWNVSFGLVGSVRWDERDRTLDAPWPALVSALQRALGPRSAGRRPDSFRRLENGLTETRWGTYSVLANPSPQRVVVDGYGLPANGFLARTDDGSLVAGAFEGLYGGAPLPPGIHVLLAERDGDGGATLRRLLTL
ncbi:MAG TPA: DUF6259 domain-containing protein [Gaiellaceae bacterium]|nr:DUF6259 domain-containing protein [Gaiellaceae bacterium]